MFSDKNIQLDGAIIDAVRYYHTLTNYVLENYLSSSKTIAECVLFYLKNLRSPKTCDQEATVDKYYLDSLLDVRLLLFLVITINNI